MCIRDSAADRATAGGVRCGYVVGVGGRRGAEDLGEDGRATRDGVVPLLENQDAGAFTHYESIAVDVKGPREFLVAERGHVAVSYTHLRAHETVLDLVCRLLLEKKK